ncbi:hypothetical protein D5S17_30305 [Pseudonocardiaceae bacterium YIM PH 21723]|nr:hypothetical protein D5S17_30305 [Pseudonocardiaceae bacterium YIM PH 21723]
MRQPISIEAERFFAGSGDPEQLLRAFRMSTFAIWAYSPDRALVTIVYRGLRWIPCFTTGELLAEFLESRQVDAENAEFVVATGERVIDEFLPALEKGVGIIVDPGAEQPVAFPPLRPIVPDELALDAS